MHNGMHNRGSCMRSRGYVTHSLRIALRITFRTLSLCLAEVTDLVTLRYNKITEWVLSGVHYTWAGISSGF